MRHFSVLLGFGVFALAAYLLLWPIPVDPVAWSLPPNPGLIGDYQKNERLADLIPIELDGRGPEDLTLGADGFWYTGLEDGRVIRFQPDDAGNATTYVNTGGRPLGLQFDALGNLIVADAERGLLSIAPDRSVTVLTNSTDEGPLEFVNDLDIGRDGTIWFSDATQRFNGDPMLNFLEGSASGRLLSYDPTSGKTQMRVDDLRFANGVALGPDDAYVLVNETLGARITRLWIKGPHAGSSDVFLDGLPGHPDNISFNGKDLFWIAIPMARMPAFERLNDKPLIRAMMMRLPQFRSSTIDPVGWVIGVDTQGNVRHNLQVWNGPYSAITSVNEFQGALFVGSVEMSGIGRFLLSGSGFASSRQ